MQKANPIQVLVSGIYLQHWQSQISLLGIEARTAFVSQAQEIVGVSHGFCVTARESDTVANAVKSALRLWCSYVYHNAQPKYLRCSSISPRSCPQEDVPQWWVLRDKAGEGHRCLSEERCNVTADNVILGTAGRRWISAVQSETSSIHPDFILFFKCWKETTMKKDHDHRNPNRAACTSLKSPFFGIPHSTSCRG